MTKRLALMALMAFPLLFLAGWGKKEVSLLDDKKLIDLDKAIELCIPGADSPENTDGNPDGDSTSSEMADSGDGTNASNISENANMEDSKKIHIIRVIETMAIYDEGKSPYTNMDELRERIKRDNGKNTAFRLVDDYAEAHVYREVMKILAELKEEVGLEYSMD